MSIQKLLLTIFTFIGFNTLHAQVVYKMPSAQKSELIVYETNYKEEADLMVYRTQYAANAVDNKGIWFITKNVAEADKRVFITKDKVKAKLIIMYTADINEAGWRNKRKEYLMK